MIIFIFKLNSHAQTFRIERLGSDSRKTQHGRKQIPMSQSKREENMQPAQSAGNARNLGHGRFWHCS